MIKNDIALQCKLNNAIDLNCYHNLNGKSDLNIFRINFMKMWWLNSEVFFSAWIVCFSFDKSKHFGFAVKSTFEWIWVSKRFSGNFCLMLGQFKLFKTH